MFGLGKSRKLSSIITHNSILANQKSESVSYLWLCVCAMFDLICFPAFVRASDVFSGLLPICLLHAHDLSTSTLLVNILIFMFYVLGTFFIHNYKLAAIIEICMWQKTECDGGICGLLHMSTLLKLM